MLMKDTLFLFLVIKLLLTKRLYIRLIYFFERLKGLFVMYITIRTELLKSGIF